MRERKRAKADLSCIEIEKLEKHVRRTEILMHCYGYPIILLNEILRSAQTIDSSIRLGEMDGDFPTMRPTTTPGIRNSIPRMHIVNGAPGGHDL